MDIIVIELPDGHIHSSSFHVRFTSKQVLTSQNVDVLIYINDKKKDIKMKLAKSGDAYFSLEKLDKYILDQSNIKIPTDNNDDYYYYDTKIKNKHSSLFPTEEQIKKISEQITLREKLKNHDNILGFINGWYEEYQNIYVIIEELCSGGNINSNYKYIQKPKLKLIKKWIKEILNALDYLHSNNIIHHDIKCENIYLDRISGNLKVGCMGSIEKLPSGAEYFEKYAGTPEFMAPEVNEGKYNFKADIYSLGLSLIELLTVQKPYKECEGALDIYINKKKGNLPESFKLITDKGIREFIMLCLNKENKRPSAKELLEKNKWLNDKKNCENNSIIEIKGSLRQKNFYLNNKYKSGGIIDVRRLSNKNVIKYNSKIFNAFNLKSKNSFYTNYNSSGKLANNSNTINNDKSSSFSYRNNIIFNKSTTTSRTDNFFSNKSNIHNDEENNEPKINTNKIIDDIYSNNSNFNSNNESRNCSSNNLINLNNINHPQFNKLSPLTPLI